MLLCRKSRVLAVVVLLAGVLCCGELSSRPKGVTYYLPLEYGDKREIFQGNNQGPTHNASHSRYAFDFSPMAVGTPVVAAADGVVSAVKEDSAGPTGNWMDNNLVVLRHADGNVGEYLHLKRSGAVVEVGQKVMRGDLIGYSGNTGSSGAPHLHFGLRKGHHLTGASVPCKFADVPGDGVPKKGDTVTSKNFPVRYQKEYDEIEGTVALLKLCSGLECLEAVTKRIKSFAKIKIPMPLTMLKAAIKKRDDALKAYEQAAGQALEALQKARGAKDVKAAVRLAYFGEKDFAGSKRKRDFKKAHAQFRKEQGYKEAVNSLKSERDYRTRAARAIKSELKVKEKKRKKKKRGKVSYSSVIKQYQAAFTLAPNTDIAANIGKHCEELKTGQ